MSQLAEQPEATLPPAITPPQMLGIAVQQGADLNKLEKLMDLQDRWEASEAKKQFTKALSDFQSKLGPIIKKRKAHNSTYADIDDIAQAIRPILDEVGLSYRFDQTQQDGQISVSCIVSHSAGHVEKTTLSAGNDNSGGKNQIQAMASTVTYLRRYTLTGALGITTGQDDNDGGKPAIQTQELLEFMELVREEFFSLADLKRCLLEDDYSGAKEAWAELDRETQTKLYRAPTKGGILTTKERQQMKSNEWSAA